MRDFQEKKKNRWLMLRTFYEKANGVTDCLISFWDVGKFLGWDPNTTSSTYNYLANEGLLESMSLRGEATITHKGVKEVEKVEENPDQPTSYFPANITIYKDKVIHGDNFEGDMNNSTGDTYNVSGQAGAVGKNANATNNNFFQSQSEKQTLAKAAKEIKELLKQLEKNDPSATEEEKIAYINDETSPRFKRRTAGALKALGESVLDEYVLDSHWLKVVKDTIQGWVEPD